jgi:hypothetical protein
MLIYYPICLVGKPSGRRGRALFTLLDTTKKPADQVLQPDLLAGIGYLFIA